jgi:N-acetylglucosaminyl-diphospho-decaprenol L-rhamnosyltransferase
MPAPRVTVSVVSHGQNALVNGLLEDLARHCAADISLLLTENVPDRIPFNAEGWGQRIQVNRNRQPRGFGANHNAAFRACGTPLFCVLNPDIRFAADPFPPLVASLADPRVAAAGPLVRSPAGAIEDSARRFPTLMSLARKALGPQPGPEYPADQGPLEADWVGGMFMLLSSDAFRSVGGFDERYFLYYEDVDLCRRLRAAGKSVVYNPLAAVVHDARRGSRRNPGLMRHHAASLLRYLLR